jgi:hypothetical protein
MKDDSQTPADHEDTKNTHTRDERLAKGWLCVLRDLRDFVMSRPGLCMVAGVLSAVALAGGTVRAHSGPPFPIATDRVVAAYRVSVWADPDATDDRSAAGQFWVMLQPSRTGDAIPVGTRVDVTIRPLDRPGAAQTGRAEPVNADVARQFVALVMDHEGPFDVRVAIDGPLGQADVDASTDATYDLRPRPLLMIVFVMPFLVVGFIWGKLLIRRRMHARGEP